MADADEDAALQAERLFDKLSFYLTSHCPSRLYYKQLLQTNGGKICQTDRAADVIISDHLKSQGTVEQAISYKWIDKCVEERDLVDPEDFVISKLIQSKKGAVTSKKTTTKNTASSVKEQVAAAGPSSRRVGGRSEFTAEDDAILLWWLEHAEHRGGNVIYKELARHFDNHTWHSWRDHWIKGLSKEAKYRDGPKPPSGFDITKVRGWHEGIIRPGDPSWNPQAPAAPHRRRPSEHTVVSESARKHERSPVASSEDQIVEHLNELLRDNTEREAQVLETMKNMTEEQAAKYRLLLSAELQQQNEERERIDQAMAPTGKFTLEETKALISKGDDITYSDTKDEQLGVCQGLVDTFNSHSAEDFLDYFLKKIKPIMKQIIKKGKVQGQQMEAAVLENLKSDAEMEAIEQQQRAWSGDAAQEEAGTRGLSTALDARFDNLDTSDVASRPSVPKPIERSGRGGKLENQLFVSPAVPATKIYSSQSTTSFRSRWRPHDDQSYSEERELARLRAELDDTRSLRSVFRVPAGSHTPKSNSPPRTPITIKPTQKSPLDKIAVRTDPPSQRSSPTPRQGVAVLTSDAETEPISPTARKHAALEHAIKTRDQSSPVKLAGEGVPASSPPLSLRPAINQLTPREAAPASSRRLPPLGTNFPSVSSAYEESDDIPYREPTKAIPSSNYKAVRTSSSRPTSKRRKIEGASYSDMVVENTPENKLAPIQDTSSPQSTTPNQPSHSFSQRGLSPTLSPLAQKSLKRKALANNSAEHSARSSPESDHLTENTDTDEDAGSDSEDEEDAEIDIGGFLNRNLGLLNDNSPRPHPRHTETPMSEMSQQPDEMDQNSTQEIPQESKLSDFDKLWAEEFMPWIKKKAEWYHVGPQDVALILERTCCSRKLTNFVLEGLLLHLRHDGTFENFVWPEVKGIWTEEDDMALAGDADEDELFRVAQKHGDENLSLRWDWLERMNKVAPERESQTQQSSKK
ncbi:hypothetical protein TWF696_006706 [Orbilia brochopaga]|uniref:DNA-binding protein RAP1 n=1 Tax=Orbilia brochopaga TaxID=3140254 RepID=A0AAV9UQT1_9PEZI